MLQGEKVQYVEPNNTSVATLLLISPDHGRVEYNWQRKKELDWDSIDSPKDTCVLYVKDCGLYRCTVANKHYFFEVRGEIYYFLKSKN